MICNILYPSFIPFAPESDYLSLSVICSESAASAQMSQAAVNTSSPSFFFLLLFAATFAPADDVLFLFLIRSRTKPEEVSPLLSFPLYFEGTLPLSGFKLPALRRQIKLKGEELHENLHTRRSPSTFSNMYARSTCMRSVRCLLDVHP